MPLTLITGPANAAKAGAVLERFRAALPHEPVLVVPTPADADHYRRELAYQGMVLGADVATFSGLVRMVAEATGVRPKVLGRVARERVVRAAVAGNRLQALARSAAVQDGRLVRAPGASCARARPELRPRCAAPHRSGGAASGAEGRPPPPCPARSARPRHRGARTRSRRACRACGR